MFTSDRSERIFTACVQCIKKDIIPLTAQGVKGGSKLFGAAILRQDDLSTVIAATNNEMENPLWHGEVHCIKKFYEMPAEQRPPPKDCIFLCTHEPCSLCLSAITWSGFNFFTYLFTYEDSRDLFAIPHDINILEQVYRVPTPTDNAETLAKRPLYNKRNAFFDSASLNDLADAVERVPQRADLQAALEGAKAEYNALSEEYQRHKGQADIAFA